MSSVRSNSEHCLKLCSINICGLSARSKITLDKYNHTHKFDIIAVQETETAVAEKLQIENMKEFPDTNQARNSGAALYVKSDIHCTRLPEISKASKQLDSAWCLAVINNKRFIVGSVYVKLNHSTAITETIKMLKAAQTKRAKLKACGVILTGDFNARHSLWGDHVDNPYGRQLVDELDHTEFSIVTSNAPTFLCENGSSHIDLMIMSKNIANNVKSCETDDEIELFSGAPMRGHVPLISEIACGRNNRKTPVTKKLDIKGVNWELWSGDLESELERDKNEVARYKNPAKLWKYFDKTVEKVTSKHGVWKKSSRHSKPYWSEKLTVLCDRMREARKTFKRRNTETNKLMMDQSKEEFDSERKAECEQFILEKTKKLNTAGLRTFWKEFKRIFRKKSEGGIEPLDDGTGGLVTESKEMEDQLFATFFQCKHMYNVNFDDYFYETVNDLYEEALSEDIYNIEEDEDQTELNAPISIPEIMKAIKKTDANKVSLDNHQMHPKMLHSFGNRATKLIQRIFNMSLNKSKWVWNQADVIFFKKAGKESYAAPGSYRPISITSYIGKLLEKIIAVRIIRFLIRKGYYDPDQEGFTAGRNTVRYLNRLNLEIKSDLFDQKTVIGLFVDMEKAFDSVWKRGLIVKLSKLNIKGKVLHLIDNFLKSRVVKLNINGQQGEERDCEGYGLPQGSALSPVLFKIYVMDILDDLGEDEEINIYKFADDGTIKISSETTDQCLTGLNRVILSLNRWTEKWRMIINCNKNKTEYICFGTAERNADIPESIQIGDKTVNRVSQTKVLGLTIDEKLSYIPQSNEVHKVILGKWATICQYSNIHWGFNQRVLTQLINTLFTPIIQYAGHIWINQRNMKDIDQLWNKLIKSAVGSIFNIKTSIGEVIIGVPPINIQTVINRIKHILKLNIYKLPEDKLSKYVSDCTNMIKSQPVELKNGLKDVLKFLKWKWVRSPEDFNEDDVQIVNGQEFCNYSELSPKSCSYTKSAIRAYTEKIWQEKLNNQGILDGDPHIPKPQYMKMPIPHNTSRREEVLLMSMFYPQNLLNSFVYRHTHSTESPLCPRCMLQEQTPFHVIYECNDICEELQVIIRSNAEEREVQQADCTTLLNCSRSEEFVRKCLTVLSQGEFRHSIDL